MTNEMKLLMALCDALGFDVEKLVDTKETPISEQNGKNRIASHIVTFGGLAIDLATNRADGGFKRGDDGCYFLKASMDIDYKLTKKG